MFAPTKAMYDTVPAFMDSAKEVQIDSVFGYKEAKKAFERIESGRARGKVVVSVS
jgi:NADPH:quinone reductase-like Zn-dependent oxidoreductase